MHSSTRCSPLDNWLRQFGSRLLNSTAFRSVLHSVEADELPGGGSLASATRYLKEWAVRLNDA